MRQILKLVILLYPKPWRNRYANEFDALLDAVRPTWATFFDVLRGAMKMQMKSGSLWKAAAFAAVVGVLAGVTFSRLMPFQYQSEAVIQPDKTQLNAETATVLSRANLTRLILRENLYEKDRARVPIEELILWLRSSILLWSDRKDGPLRVRVNAADAAQALKPLADKYAYILFAVGLFNASLFAASILPLSTAYTVCEGLGFESGVDKKFGEAPFFYWLYTLLIVAGGAVLLIPGLPLVKIAVLSQVVNGVVLPFVLIFMLLLINKKELMGKYVNTSLFNAVDTKSRSMLPSRMVDR